MNAKSILIVFSILLNGLLVAKLAMVKQAQPQSKTDNSTASAGNSSTGGVVIPSRLKLASGTNATFSWRKVESTDYREYIQNLRAIECPELTIQEIVIADIDKLYAAREKALQASTVISANYWEPKSIKGITAEADRRQKLLSLKREKNAIIYELLKVQMPLYGDNEKQLYGSDPQRVLATIPEDKRLEVAYITQKYDTLSQEMWDKGVYTPEDNRKINEVRKARLAELEALLGVPAARDYFAQTSWFARELKSQLVGFNPTEAEFRTIHDLKERLDFNFGNSGHYDNTDSEGLSKLQQGTRETEDKIKQALGPQRYAEYRRTSDPSYQSLVKLANSFELPDEGAVANTVYTTRTDFEQKRMQLLTDNSMSQADRMAAIQQTRAEAEAKVQGTLGEKAFQKYRSQGGSWLLENAQPRPLMRDAAGNILR
ncbi:MAG: hypothetical protein JWN25_3425 [Verrucomicrobiales bacterium]|nr:hypothetical protein [Verrucomicrobiales bacterium]